MEACNACEKESAPLIRDGRLLLCGACLVSYYGSGDDDAEPPDACAVCDEPADVLDDGLVPLCARCYDDAREPDAARDGAACSEACGHCGRCS